QHRDAPADATARARDDGDLPFERTHGSPPVASCPRIRLAARRQGDGRGARRRLLAVRVLRPHVQVDELLAALLARRRDDAAHGDLPVEQVHPTVAHPEALHAALVAREREEQAPDQRVLEPPVDDVLGEPHRLKHEKVLVEVQRVEVATAGRELHELLLVRRDRDRRQLLADLHVFEVRLFRHVVSVLSLRRPCDGAAYMWIEVSRCFATTWPVALFLYTDSFVTKSIGRPPSRSLRSARCDVSTRTSPAQM